MDSTMTFEYTNSSEETETSRADICVDGAGQRENVSLTAEVLPVLNYAIYRNGSAAVRAITIENHSDVVIENVQLEILSSPELFHPFTLQIDCLPEKKPVTVAKPGLVVNEGFLSSLTEKISVSLKISIRHEGAVLASQWQETSVLSFDEWHGLNIYPELLASFVTPNHPCIGSILSRASDYLGSWTGDTSLDAYQTQDSNRVLQQCAAIFVAIKDLGLSYAVPPASFEQMGQRIRMCDTVLQQKLGTCLDLTLLYVSCLEAAGLYPLLIATPGHILTGIWLEERMFPECVQDDVSLIRKRLASGIQELAVVETTLVTTAGDNSFDDARAAAKRKLAQQQTNAIIDVHRARLSGVLPMPQRFSTDSGWTLVEQQPAPQAEHMAPQKLDVQIPEEGDAPDSEMPRKMQWERKLLDLGMRNTLINLRPTKTQLPILVDSLETMENALMEGREFSILPRPVDLAPDVASFEVLARQCHTGIIGEEFKNNRIRSILTDTELSKTIKGLYRTAKTALEENGANTLYLAMGMLKWYETKKSTKTRYAPIILIPIEMVRKSASQGYVIRLRDDEPQMNITLLEKLKQDFGIQIRGLDPLPQDERGVDIRRVLTIVRKAVMEQSRWDVLEIATIGIFSFSQFVMWNDIRNRTEDLLRNKVVRSLMEGKLTWQAQPLDMGAHVEEGNVLLPMAADASQLFAIQTACAGESFVLHGPPGTGKSQTITSLIANALAQGKRVLFVAEKMAALEVVQRRLDSIGIGPFCLELHSNKSRKRAVLDQLRHASEVTKTAAPRAFADRAEQLATLREELDGYAHALHNILPCGSSLYALINAYEEVRTASQMKPFATAFLRTLTRREMENQQILLERLTAAGQGVGHPHDHPLALVGAVEYSNHLRQALPDIICRYHDQLQQIMDWVEALLELPGERRPESFEALQLLQKRAELLACWYDLPQAWAQAEYPRQYFAGVLELASHARIAAAQEGKLLEIFRESFLTQDGEELMTLYRQTTGKWFLPRLLGMNKLLSRLNGFARESLEKEKLPEYLEMLCTYRQERKKADDLLEIYGKDLAGFHTGSETDWDRLGKMAERACGSAEALYDAYGTHDVLHNFAGKREYQKAVMGLSERFCEFVQARDAVNGLLNLTSRKQENWLEGQNLLCRNIQDHLDQLRSWTAYRAAAAAAEAAGLGNVINAYEAGLSREQVLPAWRKTLLQGLISIAVDDSPELSWFSGTVFDQKIQQFKRLDQQWTQLSRQEIYCRLAARVPNFTAEAAQSSELGILQRCIKSGGRGMSIRRLFDQIPNLLPRLCPCMLMSPISAAQYLDPKAEPFDIVVFDEASQLPTCKAVGVLARGRDAVIVGDPKQMPPTSFFATNTVDEDNLDTEDLESILDDCLALNMPQSHLLWHYRSRHESLIAFSNSRFYENKLLTFPSVNDRETRVRLIPVDGVFERGKTRRNRAEAEAVVAELKRRFADPALSGQSIGVVTFNISQQNLIDDLLNEACVQNPELEKWAFGSEEPVFIKNLENVQGDERDVILFSIGYGPDEDGKVYMNFGPLNREGGWRRLNVAVTRARSEMVVFSALRPDQIDLNRTRAEGVAALRGFLEYAQGRTLALDVAELQQTRQTHGAVASAVCSALREKGYETDLSVGSSQYRVDIGVVDPQAPDRYLLGILLDGPGYGSARTTRDRELSQTGVLQGLGWNLHRLWSMDWWYDSEKEIERILSILKELQENRDSRKSEPVKLPPDEKLQSREAPVPVVEVPAQPPVYQAAVLTMKAIAPEDFTEPRYRRELQKRIGAVLREEAPISTALLTRRVVQSCGISRAGSRIQSHMERLLKDMGVLLSHQGEMEFCWRADQDPDEYRLFRVNGKEDSRRDIREVPVQEIAAAIYCVLYEQIGMTREDLMREAARKLGYTRLGGNVNAEMEYAVAYAQIAGGITEGANGTLTLTKEGMQWTETILHAFREQSSGKKKGR